MSRPVRKTAEIWKYLYQEGICDAVQVAHALKLDVGETRHKLQDMLMFKEVKRFEKKEGDPKSRVGYGIDGDCLTPYGVELKEILQ